MKRFILFIGCWLACSFSFAQGSDADESADHINAIKRDSKYIYAEYTMRDPVEAQSGARAVLEQKVSDWVRSDYPEENIENCVAKARENWVDLYSKRGNYSRVLVYVKKSAIIPEAEQPEEEPEPVVEEVLEPVLLTQDEGNMVAIVFFVDIEPYVKDLKNEGRVRAYGKYASLPKDEVCYLFVYDREGSVVAVLRQSEDGQYFNLRTMTDDNVRNYKNCGAIWLQLK